MGSQIGKMFFWWEVDVIDNALVLSGGGSKGAFTAGMVQVLIDEASLQFDLAVGTSTGSLIGGPALLGDTDYLANVYTTISNDDIFDNTLLGRLFGTPIDASLEPLHQFLVSYYLRDGHLDKLLYRGKTLVVSMVNVRTGKVHFVSSGDVRFNGKPGLRPATFVRAILASCSEPVFTEPVRVYEEEEDSEFRKDLFYDGGVKEFLPLEEAIRREARRVYAISTHRLQAAETGWGDDTTPDRVGKLKALIWTVSSMLDEVARGDRYRADILFRMNRVRQLVEKLRATGRISDSDGAVLRERIDQITGLGHKLEGLHLVYPEVEMETSLEFNSRIMMGYFREGKRIARGFLDSGSPEFPDSGLGPWSHVVHEKKSKMMFRI